MDTLGSIIEVFEQMRQMQQVQARNLPLDLQFPDT